MKKKIIYIITPICILILVAIILFFNIPRVKYVYDEASDSYYVSKVYGNSKSYTISSSYNDKAVVGISDRAFYKKDRLEEIILPQSIKIINRLAFSECTNLKKINLENVVEIQRNAFSYCYNLDNLTLNAQKLGASVFYDCNKLKMIDLGNELLFIGSMAFSKTAIASINIPRSVTTLGDNCFSYCNNLANINVYGDNLKNNAYLRTLKIVNYIG